MLACSKNEPKKGNSAKSIRVTLSIFNAMGCALLSFAVSAPAEPCADIADLKYPNAVISVAEAFRGGAFTPEGQKSIEDLPEFCRVAAVLRPSSDSDIRVEVWMPRANWNGRLEGTGNGGFAGSIVYKSLADGVRHGYAVVNTDMGMSVPSGSDPSIFANRPERWTDWGWRSTHEMTLLAKLVVKAYYGRDANKSYFEGCSTGGEQGLAEAQRFPRITTELWPVPLRTTGPACISVFCGTLPRYKERPMLIFRSRSSARCTMPSWQPAGVIARCARDFSTIFKRADSILRLCSAPGLMAITA